MRGQRWPRTRESTLFMKFKDNFSGEITFKGVSQRVSQCFPEKQSGKGREHISVGETVISKDQSGVQAWSSGVMA